MGEELKAYLERAMAKREPRVRRHVRVTGLSKEHLEARGYRPVPWGSKSQALRVGQVLARVQGDASVLQEVLERDGWAFAPTWCLPLFDGRISPRQRAQLFERLQGSRELRKAVSAAWRLGGLEVAREVLLASA